MSMNPNDDRNAGAMPSGVSRRNFLKTVGAAAVAADGLLGRAIAADAPAADERSAAPGVLSGEVAITLTINGKPRKLKVEPRTTLLSAMRDRLGTPDHLSPVQQAFCEKDAMMCGFCTSGFVTSVTALLQSNPDPSLEQIREGCKGNFCRCGTFPHVFEAAQAAAKAMKKV